MNHQPFYHEITVMFTATCYVSPADRQRVREAIQEALSDVNGVIPETIDVEYATPEPGDPADLL